MIKVKNLRALSDLSLDYLVIKWEIEDTQESLTNYRFDIYRCVGTDNEDDYELVSKIKGNIFEFYDTGALQYKRGVHFYYKVIPIYIPSEIQGEAEKCLSLYDRRNDVYANYIRHVNNVYLNVIGNKEGYILTKRRFGQKCSRCWDDIRRQHSRHNCPNCFGTGYEGGYHLPNKVKFNYMSTTSAMSENIGVDGRGDNNQDINIWIGNYPIVSIGDIFVDENNNRYKVNQIQRTTKNNEHILRQILNMQLLSTSDPVYDIIIDVGGDFYE